MSKPIPSASVQDAFALSKSEIASVANGLYAGRADVSASATRVSFRQGKKEKDVITLTLRAGEAQIAWATLTGQAAASGTTPKVRIEVFSNHPGERGEKAVRLMERALRDFTAAATAHLAHKREVLAAMREVVAARLESVSDADMDTSAASFVLGFAASDSRAFHEALKFAAANHVHAGFDLETKEISDGIALILNAEGGAAAYVRIPHGRTPVPSIHLNADLGLSPDVAERLERVSQAAFTHVAAQAVSRLSRTREDAGFAM